MGCSSACALGGYCYLCDGDFDYSDYYSDYVRVLGMYDTAKARADAAEDRADREKDRADAAEARLTELEVALEIVGKALGR